MAYPFAAAEVLTAVDLNAMIGAPTQNAITTVTYTAVLLDAGKTVTLSNASAVTLTIPAQASVAWAANTQLNFLNIGAGTVTIVPAATVTINGTPLTLTTSQGGSLVRTASNTWTFIPTGAGGKVLQVVRATDTTDRSTTSTSFVDASISVTITPRVSTSRILVIGTAAFDVKSSSGTAPIGVVQLTTAGNVVLSSAEALFLGVFINASSGELYSSYNIIGYIEPGSIAALTLKTRFRSTNGVVTMALRNAGTTGQMYAIEVAA